jgi:hypothetical protein
MVDIIIGDTNRMKCPVNNKYDGVFNVIFSETACVLDETKGQVYIYGGWHFNLDWFSVNDISGLPILEVFSDETILMGDYSAPSLNTTTKVTSITGSNTIYSIDKSLYTGAFFEYTVTKDSNARAGRIMSVWNGLTASYTENQTSDIGSTSDIVFVVSATGSNVVLSASASSNNWIIKTIIRSI